MKTYKAVIFDLYGTLIDELMHPEANRLVYVQNRNEMADVLGVDRDEFAKEWTDAFLRTYGRSLSLHKSSANAYMQKIRSRA